MCASCVVYTVWLHMAGMLHGTVAMHALFYALLLIASFVVCAVYNVQDQHNLPNDSPLLKNTCIRQVVLDKCFPPNKGSVAFADTGMGRK